MTDHASIAIQTRRLTRYFGRRAVVRELDFAVPRGSVVGLLGLNGAGKTTTIRMLLGLLAPTRGSCEVLGRNSQELTPDDRTRIGHTVEGHFLYPWMRVSDCAKFERDTHAKWNANFFDQTVARFGIDPTARVHWLSRGQRAGVSIAATLATDPELLILDDPALGLDPVSRRALNETIIDFCDGGERTVLLSSHLLDDVEHVADRIALMVDGRLLVNATLDNFRDGVSAWAAPTSADLTAIESIAGYVHSRIRGGRRIITLANATEESAMVLAKYGAVREHDEVSFADAVLAYLSRSRVEQSFYHRGVVQ